jgi:hypothetical protein
MKFFSCKRLTKKQLRSEICKFAKEAGVKKVIFNATGRKVSGTYHSRVKHLYISLNQTKQQMLRTFFHEMGHHEAVLNNMWTSFHFNLVSTIRVDVLFDIENNIDQIGKKLWNKNVDSKQWGMYKYFYPKRDKTTFMKNLS